MQHNNNAEIEESRFVNSYSARELNGKYDSKDKVDPTRDKDKIKKALNRGLYRILLGEDPTID